MPHVTNSQRRKTSFFLNSLKDLTLTSSFSFKKVSKSRFFQFFWTQFIIFLYFFIYLFTFVFFKNFFLMNVYIFFFLKKKTLVYIHRSLNVYYMYIKPHLDQKSCISLISFAVDEEWKCQWKAKKTDIFCNICIKYLYLLNLFIKH